MNCSASIVYSNSWLGQTSALTNEPVTTLGAGIFRVSIAMDGTSSGPGNIEVADTLSDSLGDVMSSGSSNLNGSYQSGSGLDAAGGNRMARQSVIDSPGGIDISLSTTITVFSGGTLIGYNVYIIIEQLA